MFARVKNRGTRLLSGSIALLVAVMVPLAWAVGIAVLTQPPGFTTSAFDTSEGKQHFQILCAACHEVSSGESATLGPHLAEIGRRGASRRPPLSAPAYILESIMEPDAYRVPGANGQMPANLVRDLSDASIRNLVAYLATLGATLDALEIERLSIRKRRPVSAEDAPAFRYDRATARQGREVFEGKGRCVYCHEFEWTPSRLLFTPNLRLGSFEDGSVIRDAIRRSNHILNAAYQHYALQTNAGTEIRGRILKRGRDTIRVLRWEDTGKAEPLDLSLAEMARHADGEPMIEMIPLSLVDRYALSEDDIEALVIFLQLSKAEGDD